MKKSLFFLLTFVCTAGFGQSVSDYSKIIVPAKFSNMTAGRFDLNNLLSKKLKEKKYIVSKDNADLNEPCEMLTADVVNTSNMFTNKLRVDFKDCNQKIIKSFEGKSTIKEFDEGMQDALNIALKGLAVSNGLAETIEKPKQQIVSTETTTTTTTSIASAPTESKVIKNEEKPANAAEVYTNGTLVLNKINLSENQFILTNPNSSTPYAVFNSTTKKDVYRVKLQNGSSSLGYLENGTIVIETANPDGSFNKEVFKKN